MRNRITWKTRLLIYVPLTAAAMMALMPLYWLLTGAIKPPETLMKMPPDLVPRGFTLQHIKQLFELSPAGVWVVNSLLVSTVVTASNVVLCAMAGYGFAKMRFPGSRTIFWVCLCTMMVPPQVTVVPLFLMVRQFGLINTYPGLVFPMLVTAFGIFLMKQYIQSIPSELIEAARIDGASEMYLFWRIIFPVTKPAVAVLAILTFTSSWNNFLWPLLVAVDNDMWTLPVGVASMNDSMYRSVGLTMAAAAIAAAPMIILFLTLQRYFLKGLTVGAVKG